MLIGSWNEKDNPDLPARQVLADARAVHRRFHGSAIIGAQEIGEWADHNAIDRAFGSRWAQVPRVQATPLVFNRWHFRLLDFGWVKTHSGVAHVTPHRGFTWGKFKKRRRPLLEPFYVYNTHLISKPYLDQARAAMYDRHVEKMRAHIATKAADSLDIFIVGDFNKKAPPALHERQVVLHSHWLDHILWIPGARGNEVRLDQRITMTGPLHTDHDPIAVVLELDPKDAP